MKKAFKRIAKRIFILILLVFAVYLVISNIDLIRDLASNEKIKVIIDSDTANGVDDLFAIMRVMEAEEMDVRGLLSAQWRLVDLDNDSTLSLNQDLHRKILWHYRKDRIPSPSGSNLPIRYLPAGKSSPNNASKAIIRAVHELPYQQKLNVLCLGTATNLAAAILEKPEIIDKIVCYIQGPYYDPARRSWDKSDPVTRLDLEATDILLNTENLEIHLIPADIAAEMVILKKEVREEWNDPDSLQKIIIKRMEDIYRGNDSIPSSSLALAEAFLSPDMSTQKQLIAPPENSQRKIYVYTRIDGDRMKKNFWKATREKREK